LCLAHSREKELETSIQEEVVTLEDVMALVYQEMMNLHHIVSKFPTIQAESKQNTYILK